MKTISLSLAISVCALISYISPAAHAEKRVVKSEIHILGTYNGANKPDLNETTEDGHIVTISDAEIIILMMNSPDSSQIGYVKYRIPALVTIVKKRGFDALNDLTYYHEYYGLKNIDGLTIGDLFDKKFTGTKSGFGFLFANVQFMNLTNKENNAEIFNNLSLGGGIGGIEIGSEIELEINEPNETVSVTTYSPRGEVTEEKSFQELINTQLGETK